MGDVDLHVLMVNTATLYSPHPDVKWQLIVLTWISCTNGSSSLGQYFIEFIPKYFMGFDVIWSRESLGFATWPNM